MKVLKAGRSQRGWSTESTCTGNGNGGGGCGAKLLIEEPDLFITASHCRDETDYFCTFKCVSCGVLTDIKNVPSAVEGRLPTQRVWEQREAAHPIGTTTRDTNG